MRYYRDVPALCTHRPSLLPIEWFSEVSGSAALGAATLPVARREAGQTVLFRGSKSRNKVFFCPYRYVLCGCPFRSTYKSCQPPRFPVPLEPIVIVVNGLPLSKIFREYFRTHRAEDPAEVRVTLNDWKSAFAIRLIAGADGGPGTHGKI